MTAQHTDSEEVRKLLLRGESIVFEAERTTILVFLPPLPPRMYGKKKSSKTKAQPSEVMRFFRFSVMIFAFVSLNTLNLTFKKLPRRGGQAVVKLTDPPTSLPGGSFQGRVNVYLCEPDPETARKGTKFSL